jgi:hypothetical protein
LRLRQYKFCRSGQAAESKEKTYFSVGFLSGRPDLNWGPHGPEPCALAELSHAP